MAISRRLRFEILRRDGHTCRYCGARAPDVTLTVDHVIPVTLGGGDEPNNLVTACADCNSGKSSVSADAAIVEDVDAAALLWAKAIEVAAERRRQAQTDIDERTTLFFRHWRGYTYNNDGAAIPLPDDWRSSIERFLTHGLTWEELSIIVDDTMTVRNVRDEFRLFCKKAWTEIGHRQELARRLIEDGEV